LQHAIEDGYITVEWPIPCGPWILNEQNLKSESALRFLERVRTNKMHGVVPSPLQAVLDLSTT
jgi:hypothetical protein